MHYTYVLLCSDGKLYVGSTSDLRARFGDHELGRVKSTKTRRPVMLVYYEACLSKEFASERERYFKTGFGRKFLKGRIHLPS